MPIFYNTSGNIEVWKEKPEGYLTPEEWRLAHPDPEPEPPSEEERAEEERLRAREESASLLMARMQTRLAQTEAFSAGELTTLARAGLFETWAPGSVYAAGFRLLHEGIVYEVVQEVTALENQPPNGEGMLAIYRPLSADAETGTEPAGTREDPFTYIYGMDVTTGSYYSFNGKLYLAKADMKPCVWDPGTPGLWQWEEVVDINE